MGNAPPLITALLDQARELRFRGDMVNALMKLREARLIEPRNGSVLAEIAATYEKMENRDQAQTYWRELRSLGDSAGVLRELADYKLGRGTAQAAGSDPLIARQSGSRTAPFNGGSASTSTSEPAARQADQSAMSPSVNCSSTDRPDPSSSVSARAAIEVNTRAGRSATIASDTPRDQSRQRCAS